MWPDATSALKPVKMYKDCGRSGVSGEREVSKTKKKKKCFRNKISTFLLDVALR